MSVTLRHSGTACEASARVAQPDWPPDEDLMAGDVVANEPDGTDSANAAELPHGDAGASGCRSEARTAASDAQLAQWIAAIVEQDERALAALYDATFTRVFGLVRRIVGASALAEEVAEDTYFQVWRQAIRFDPARGQALTWLLAMARSRALDALRREARFRHDALDDDEAAAAACDAAPPDTLLDIARRHAQLHEALLTLGAQPRQLVSLAFLRGLSHEEIAEQTELPLGTVKSQIRRALASLRKNLGARNALALVS